LVPSNKEKGKGIATKDQLLDKISKLVKEAADASDEDKQDDKDNDLDLPKLILVPKIRMDELEPIHHFEPLFNADAFESKEEAKWFTKSFFRGNLKSKKAQGGGKSWAYWCEDQNDEGCIQHYNLQTMIR
jgi:hypothetical protein